MRLLITGLSAVILTVGCASQEPFDWDVVDETRKPVIESTDTHYEWDESKSHALNVVEMDGSQPGLMDRRLAEDAHREISTGRRVGGFLLSAWAGSVTQAAAHDSAQGRRAASYEFDPYAVLFIEQDDVEEPTFGDVHQRLTDDLTNSYQAAFDNTEVEVLVFNDAVWDHLDKDRRYSWPHDATFAIMIEGEACDVAIERRGHPELREDREIYGASKIVTSGVADRSRCRVFASVKHVGTTDVPWKDSIANGYRIEFHDIGTWVVDLAPHSDMSWVVGTRWRGFYQRIRTAAPYVTGGDKGWMFTTNNDSFSKSDIGFTNTEE